MRFSELSPSSRIKALEALKIEKRIERQYEIESAFSTAVYGISERLADKRYIRRLITALLEDKQGLMHEFEKRSIEKGWHADFKRLKNSMRRYASVHRREYTESTIENCLNTKDRNVKEVLARDIALILRS